MTFILRGKNWLKNRNTYDLAKLEMLKGLYLIHDVDLIRESFKFFKDNGLYADMEDYGVIAAEVLEGKEKFAMPVSSTELHTTEEDKFKGVGL